ncbi:hypothetical protein POM88_002051 [Heracleum sosnowskyi]|uniref:Uncharacterized protein n=1 Tax=Heracleum sosnowskyi TaxID=360622 RepID=A0AAD8JH13_9APIA|nr:hypothetical protein POM88_002051 [Heracleum sosnowskyi]
MFLNAKLGGQMKINEEDFNYDTPAEPLNTLVKYKKLLDKWIVEIMDSKIYVFGGSYNRKQFITHLEEALGVKVEVKFERIENNTDLFRLKKIGVLFNDEDWKPRDFVPKPAKRRIRGHLLIPERD